MKKSAKDLMTEEYFWEIIEQSDKGKSLKPLLMELSKDEIMGYRYWWEYFNNISYRQDLWAVPYVVLGGCSDDGFDYFRFWLVARGKNVFFDAIENPDSLCNEFDNLPDEEFPEQEEFDYIPIRVFDEKFGKDSFYTEDNYEFGLKRPDIEFEWDEDDEESIRKIIPNTFDKWWGNDVF